MQLKILGTQSPYATKGHNCPGFFVTDGKDKVLIDCGSGSHSLLNFCEDLIDLNVILTHLHRDHYNDIFNLQYASFVFHNQKRLARPIQVFMPYKPHDIYEDIAGEKNAFAKYCPIDEELILNVGDMSVSFCRMEHACDTYAVKVSDGLNTIVYSSDTSYLAKEKLANFAFGADVLICESSLLKEHGFPSINPHLTAEQAANIASDAMVKQLILTHFWPEEITAKYVMEAKRVFYNTIAATEGMIISF